MSLLKLINVRLLVFYLTGFEVAAQINIERGGSEVGQIRATKTVPLPEGGNLIIRNIKETNSVSVEPVIPEQPRAVVNSAAPGAMRERGGDIQLLFLTITRFENGVSYLEWVAPGVSEAFAAWSDANFDALSYTPDSVVSVDGVRYCIFHFLRKPSAGVQSSHASPSFPVDGSGFSLAKGDPSNVSAFGPVLSLHRTYKEQGSALKLAAEERERLQRQQDAARAVAPPQDIILNYTRIRTAGGNGGAK